MDPSELAAAFDLRRGRLRGIAYRMLGSLAEAEDVVQDAWLRLERSDPNQIEDLDAWLTTVVARLCLNAIRDRRRRTTESLGAFHPEPIVSQMAHSDPEHEALLAEAVGVALQVVLDALSPAERMAFVLHDMFAVPFAEIAEMVERSPDATRQLASRARRRVRDTAPLPDPDVHRQRVVVDAYFAAAREGDMEALIAVLDPDVVLRAHRRDDAPLELHGAEQVALGATAAGRFAPYVRPALARQRQCRRGRIRRRKAIRGPRVHGH